MIRCEKSLETVLVGADLRAAEVDVVQVVARLVSAEVHAHGLLILIVLRRGLRLVPPVGDDCAGAHILGTVHVLARADELPPA